MLGRRHRRWPSMKPALDQCPVFAEREVQRMNRDCPGGPAENTRRRANAGLMVGQRL